MSTPGSTSTLLVGKDDSLLKTMPPIVSRDDVARVMAAALTFDARSGGNRATDGLNHWPTDGDAPLSLRFDLCSKHGPPTSDLTALLESTKYPWQ